MNKSFDFLRFFRKFIFFVVPVPYTFLAIYNFSIKAVPLYQAHNWSSLINEYIKLNLAIGALVVLAIYIFKLGTKYQPILVFILYLAYILMQVFYPMK